MDELQDIFLNEIKQKKPHALPPITSHQEEQKKSDIDEKLLKEDKEKEKVKGKNLLLNILNK